MFLVINKSKILSYILAICTVVVLFMLATIEKNDEIISTSANVITTNTLNQENYIANSINNIAQNNINI